jgi:AcrR family transcriptional regulator
MSLDSLRTDEDAASPRSAGRVDDIVAAAGELLEQGPLSEVTTTRIAQQAEVAISTLYRFFADRDAIFQEIVRRNIAKSQGVAAHLTGAALKRQGNMAMIVDICAGFVAAQPGFMTLWVSGYLRPGAMPEWDNMRAGLIQVAYDGLVRDVGLPPGPDLMARMQVIAVAVEHSLRYAVTRPEPERGFLLAELKRLVRLMMSWPPA